MSALRKRRDTSGGHAFGAPPEVFDYEDDVTPGAVREVQERADRHLGEEEFVVIDGYVGRKK